MTPEEIKARWKIIDKFQEKWYDEELKLQKLCQHTNATKTRHSNTGNYDPSADSYWISHKCPDCNKTWYEDL